MHGGARLLRAVGAFLATLQGARHQKGAQTLPLHVTGGAYRRQRHQKDEDTASSRNGGGKRAPAAPVCSSRYVRKRCFAKGNARNAVFVGNAPNA